MDPQSVRRSESWYPAEAEWQSMPAAQRGEALSDWFCSLDDWRCEQEEAGRLPLGSLPTKDQDQQWIVDRVLVANIDSLPEPRSCELEQMLRLFGGDAAWRLRCATNLYECAVACVVRIVAMESGEAYVLDEGYHGIGEELAAPYGPCVLVAYDHDEARRYTAWAEAAGLEYAKELLWIGDAEYWRLESLLVQLEAKALKERAEVEANQIDRDVDLLQEADDGDYEPDDMVHRGLERAIDEGRAGHRMREELAEQYRKREVLRAGWDGIARRQAKLDEIERQVDERQGGLATE